MTTAIEAIEGKVRATRRVSSLPLVVIGLATVVAASVNLIGGLGFALGFFIAPFAAVVLWVVMKLTASRAGLGMGRERYGAVALVIVVVSLMPIFTHLLGPAFFLGVILLAVGWRAEDPRQWISGLALAVASPLLSYSFIQNSVYIVERALTGWYWFTDMTVDHVVLACFGMVLLFLGIRQFQRETLALQHLSE